MLRIFIYARQRKESLTMCFSSASGLGKTTSRSRPGNDFQFSPTAPSIERIGDMVAILTNLEAGDVLSSKKSTACPRDQRFSTVRWKISP